MQRRCCLSRTLVAVFVVAWLPQALNFPASLVLPSPGMVELFNCAVCPCNAPPSTSACGVLEHATNGRQSRRRCAKSLSKTPPSPLAITSFVGPASRSGCRRMSICRDARVAMQRLVGLIQSGHSRSGTRWLIACSTVCNAVVLWVLAALGKVTTPRF